MVLARRRRCDDRARLVGPVICVPDDPSVVRVGRRGQLAVDKEALKSTLLKVSEFVEQNPEVRELDLNPVIASGKLYLREQDKLMCYRVN